MRSLARRFVDLSGQSRGAEYKSSAMGAADDGIYIDWIVPSVQLARHATSTSTLASEARSGRNMAIGVSTKALLGIVLHKPAGAYILCSTLSGEVSACHSIHARNLSSIVILESTTLDRFAPFFVDRHKSRDTGGTESAIGNMPSSMWSSSSPFTIFHGQSLEADIAELSDHGRLDSGFMVGRHLCQFIHYFLLFLSTRNSQYNI